MESPRKSRPHHFCCWFIWTGVTKLEIFPESERGEPSPMCHFIRGWVREQNIRDEWGLWQIMPFHYSPLIEWHIRGGSEMHGNSSKMSRSRITLSRLPFCSSGAVAMLADGFPGARERQYKSKSSLVTFLFNNTFARQKIQKHSDRKMPTSAKQGRNTVNNTQHKRHPSLRYHLSSGKVYLTFSFWKVCPTALFSLDIASSLSVRVSRTSLADPGRPGPPLSPRSFSGNFKGKPVYILNRFWAQPPSGVKTLLGPLTKIVDPPMELHFFSTRTARWQEKERTTVIINVWVTCHLKWVHLYLHDFFFFFFLLQ